MTNIYDYIEDAPEWADDVAMLMHWGQNFNWGDSPFAMFCDLTNINEEPAFNYQTPMSLGYLELDYLAKALTQYTARPTDVTDWIMKAIQIEMEGDE